MPTNLVSQVGEVSLREAAEACGVPYRTFARYVERWSLRRVDGITVTRARARAGRRYVIDASIVERWRACTLTAF